MNCNCNYYYYWQIHMKHAKWQLLNSHEQSKRERELVDHIIIVGCKNKFVILITHIKHACPFNGASCSVLCSYKVFYEWRRERKKNYKLFISSRIIYHIPWNDSYFFYCFKRKQTNEEKHFFFKKTKYLTIHTSH